MDACATLDTHRLRPVAATVAIVACLASAAPALGFGTVNEPIKLQQHAEHEKITRAGLQCAPGYGPQDTPGRCFEDKSIAQLAGEEGDVGAIGASDIDAFF